jgi:hypothetical protein
MSRKAELMNKLSSGDMSVMEELKELMAPKPSAPKAEAPKHSEEPSKEEPSESKKKKK